ncbi:Mucin-5B [Holothuria leucospilota]|uniref:Mucin-5B n=1 Tax=Holothuria leucospilota TaxID=206669 RepID=A0A9Q1H0W1_HOLLE|nr:Mucin-5B [Holothuria leucospilota]
MGASTQPPTTMQTTGDLTTYETIDGTTTSDTTKVAHSVTSGTNLSESDNTTQSNGTDGYTDPHSTSVTTDVPTTTFTTHFTTDVTTEGQTTVEPPTGAPDLTLTVAGCVQIAHWTAWYNNHFPFQDGGDYEDPAEIHANEPWICDYPQDVQCREFATGQTNEEIGDVFETPCSVDHGFNCTAAMQAYTINVTFDVINYRIVDIDTEVNITELNCSFSIENTTTTQSPFSVETNMTSTTQFQSESTTEKPTTVEPTKAGYHSTTEMVSNVTSQGSNSTNVNGTDEILSMQCHNVSVTKIQTIHVNESYITIGWRIDTILKNCEDYKLRFFCPQVRDRLIGCYFEGSLNEFIANTTMEVNFGNCTSLCRESGYRYAAIQKPNEECACANTYNNNPTFSAACFSKCGDNDYPCGGMSSQSIYYTGKIDIYS